MTPNRPFRVSTLVPLYFFEPASGFPEPLVDVARTTADELNEALIASGSVLSLAKVQQAKARVWETCAAKGLEPDALRIRHHFTHLSRDQHTPGSLVIHLSTDSEAFQGHRTGEIALILQRWVHDGMPGTSPLIGHNHTADLWVGLRDSNGETVGYAHYARERALSADTPGARVRLTLDTEALYAQARQTMPFEHAHEAMRQQVAQILCTQADFLLRDAELIAASPWLTIDDRPPVREAVCEAQAHAALGQQGSPTETLTDLQALEQDARP